MLSIKSLDKNNKTFFENDQSEEYKTWNIWFNQYKKRKSNNKKMSEGEENQQFGDES